MAKKGSRYAENNKAPVRYGSPYRAGDTRFFDEQYNMWATKDGRNLYDVKYGTTRDPATGKKIDNVIKAGSRLNKYQRSKFKKMAKRYADMQSKGRAKMVKNYDKGLNVIRNNNMTMKGLPVDIVDGKARYNVDVMAEAIGLKEGELDLLKKYNKGWDGKRGQSYLEWKKISKKVAGAGKNKKARYALASNLMQLDPIYAQVDIKDTDEAYHLSKLNFAKDRGGFYNMNIDDALDESIKPGWGEKYGGAIITGLATAVNPWMGALMSTMQSQFKRIQDGDFSWGNLAKESAISAASAYAGGKGPITGSLIRTGAGAVEDIIDKDFNLGKTLKEGAISAGTAVAADLAISGVKGATSTFGTDKSLQQGVKEGIMQSGTVAEIKGMAETLGGLVKPAPLESKADPDMFAGMSEDDMDEALGIKENLSYPDDADWSYARPSAQALKDVEGHDPGGLAPGEVGISDNTGIGFEDADWSYGRPSAGALEEMATNQALFDQFGMGGRYDPRNPIGFDDSDWSYSMPSEGALVEMQQNMGPEGQFTMKNGQIIEGNPGFTEEPTIPEEGIDWAGVGGALLSGLSPVLLSMLTSGSQKKRSGSGTGDEDGGSGESMFADPFASAAGAADPFSTQQMFHTGIG